jgi:hypothetical protein
VRVIGSAEIERLRGLATPPQPDAREPRILFLTQPMTRDDAIAFFEKFFAGIESREYESAQVTIKVHPSERGRAADYEALARRFPSLCRIADGDAGQLMVEHDVVVSYTSYALIEAVGLGRTAISISGAQSPGGVFALCPIPGAIDAIPTVATPAELAALVRTAPLTTSPAAQGFFAQQPPGTLLEAVLDLLRASGHPIPAHS